MNFEQAAVYTNDRFSLGENIQDIMKEWFDMAVYEYTNVIELCGNAGEYVRKLKEQGRKIALATASTEELYKPVLKRNGILDQFDCFVSTEQVERGKGFPDVYELAAEKLGLEAKNCVVYEDIVEGIKGAKAGGFFAVACLNDHYSHDWDEMREIADRREQVTQDRVLSELHSGYTVVLLSVLSQEITAIHLIKRKEDSV